MPRNPAKIKGLCDAQMFAYQKSFLKALDTSPTARVTDWEAEFIESCLERSQPYSEAQAEIILKLMDKNPKVMPTYKHYDTPEHANEFLFDHA